MRGNEATLWRQHLRALRFADAFNPQTGWVNPAVIGIDVGITLLSAENLRSGNVSRWFMRNPKIKNALFQTNIR